jgi:hypothetical protein
LCRFDANERMALADGFAGVSFVALLVEQPDEVPRA